MERVAATEPGTLARLVQSADPRSETRGVRRYVGGILFLEGSSSESEDSSERADFLKGNRGSGFEGCGSEERGW